MERHVPPMAGAPDLEMTLVRSAGLPLSPVGLTQLKSLLDQTAAKVGNKPGAMPKVPGASIAEKFSDHALERGVDWRLFRHQEDSPIVGAVYLLREHEFPQHLVMHASFIPNHPGTHHAMHGAFEMFLEEHGVLMCAGRRGWARTLPKQGYLLSSAEEPGWWTLRLGPRDRRTTMC